MMMCVDREYQEVLQQDQIISSSSSSSLAVNNSVEKWQQLERNIIYALLATENCILEGKYTRENMLLYIQVSLFRFVSSFPLTKSNVLVYKRLFP